MSIQPDGSELVVVVNSYGTKICQSARDRALTSRRYLNVVVALVQRAEDLEAVALALNNRPRKSLDWKTPAEVFDEQLRSLRQPGVATTG
nr:hypothetical protein [Prauserella muralis]